VISHRVKGENEEFFLSSSTLLYSQLTFATKVDSIVKELLKETSHSFLKLLFTARFDRRHLGGRRWYRINLQFAVRDIGELPIREAERRQILEWSARGPKMPRWKKCAGQG
jgi:hypothetical protein